MTEYTELNSMAGGDKIQTEDFGASGKIQRIKIVIGKQDQDEGDVSRSYGLPVTTISGSQTTTISGSQTDIKNWPTIQTVNIQYLPPVTTISGSAVDIKNFPTVQKVSIQDMPPINVGNVTTLSGSQVNVTNFPTYFSVANLNYGNYLQSDNQTITNVPANLNASLTFLSNGGSSIDRWRTAGGVSDKNSTGLGAVAAYMFNTAAGGNFVRFRGDDTFGLRVQIPQGVTISGSVTTISGSKTDIQNFPTIQSVQVRDAGGALLGIPTAPVTVSGLMTGKDNSTVAQPFTLTLSSLANSTAGVGRQSSLIDNTLTQFPSALVSLNIKVGTSPTANSLIYVYLIRSNNDGTPIADDNAGTSDAGITIVNAPLLGVMLCSATTTGANYRAIFDTKFLGSLGPKWGIAIVNSTGVALNSTEGVYSYIGTNPRFT